jgi:hypothetical protein
MLSMPVRQNPGCDAPVISRQVLVKLYILEPIVRKYPAHRLSLIIPYFISQEASPLETCSGL